MDKSIDEIIVWWRKALAGGYHDSRLNASETGKLISGIEQSRKEKEWLIEAWADDIFIDDELTPMKKLKSEILKKMQQALKEGKGG